MRKRRIKDKAIDTVSSFIGGEDMRGKEAKVLEDIAERTGFIPENVIWRSDYFGSGKLGAVHYRGFYKGKKVVLKIQGVKPSISEIFMIESFARQNQSKIIRPPRLFYTMPWDTQRGYEALIMEYVSGPKIVESGRLQTEKDVVSFFRLYLEYRENCRRRPWLPRPKSKLSSKEALDRLLAVAQKVKPKSPYRRLEDVDLAKEGAVILDRIWSGIEWEFVHGHFSAEDLIRANGDVVLFSNLFWKWKHPYYDAVFAYHWFIYSLAGVRGITPEQIEKQRRLWLEEIFRLPSLNHHLLKAALLERAIAGLLVDSMAYIDEENPVAGYMVESTRKQVRLLIRELKQE